MNPARPERRPEIETDDIETGVTRLERPAPRGIVQLTVSDVGPYRALMLEAYRTHPDAFTSSAAEREKVPLSWWVERLSGTSAGNEFVFGAIADGALAGATGLRFELREKLRHKALLFGMYVRPAFREHGLGRRLVETVLDHARSRAGVCAIQLTVSEDNVAARRLYESVGFVPFGIEPLAIRVGAQYLAKVHMWRALVGP